MSTSGPVCFACGGSSRDQARDPDVAEHYYPGLWCHLSCLNSPAGIAWRERQKQADPGYTRYWRMSAVRLPTTCESCGGRCRLSAKARGMAAGTWETCCTRCSNVTRLNDRAHPAAYDRLSEAERMFLLKGQHSDWRAVVEDLARSADAKVDDARCPCGGRFSLAAEPRCPHCRAILLDSFFHFASPDPESP
jgi:hypothetical protein